MVGQACQEHTLKTSFWQSSGPMLAIHLEISLPVLELSMNFQTWKAAACVLLHFPVWSDQAIRTENAFY